MYCTNGESCLVCSEDWFVLGRKGHSYLQVKAIQSYVECILSAKGGRIPSTSSHVQKDTKLGSVRPTTARDYPVL